MVVAEEACSEFEAAVAAAESSPGSRKWALKELKLIAAVDFDYAFQLAADSIVKRNLGWPLFAGAEFPLAV